MTPPARSSRPPMDRKRTWTNPSRSGASWTSAHPTVAPERGAARAVRGAGRGDAAAGREGSAQVERLRGEHKLDREHLANEAESPPELQRRAGAQRVVVLLEPGGRNGVDAGRMCESL